MVFGGASLFVQAGIAAIQSEQERKRASKAADAARKAARAALRPTLRPPERIETDVAKQEVKLREQRRRGRLASQADKQGFLEPANIFRPILKQSFGGTTA